MKGLRRELVRGRGRKRRRSMRGLRRGLGRVRGRRRSMRV